MIKKLIKHGNSTALIIDKSLLKVLNINKDTKVKISTDGTSITITPFNTKNVFKQKVSDNEKIQKAFEYVMEKYAPALKKLAKN